MFELREIGAMGTVTGMAVSGMGVIEEALDADEAERVAAVCHARNDDIIEAHGALGEWILSGVIGLDQADVGPRHANSVRDDGVLVVGCLVGGWVQRERG